MADICNILSLTPYRVLPANNGGQLSIVSMHEHLGRICQDHVIGTINNGDDSHCSFQLHRIYPPHALRYVPWYQLNRIAGIARRYDANYIFCEHPYLAFTAIALSKRLKIPWFLRAQNIESERFRTLEKKWWRLLRAYESMAMRQADGVFFITPEDGRWALEQFQLDPTNCHFVPYGTIANRVPDVSASAKAAIAAQFQLDTQKQWIYFLGAMNYLPNIEAVQYIINQISPRLMTTNKNDYQILIAGKGLPESLQQQIATSHNISYLGFLPELDGFLKACDIMINPVLTGGGIKTKAVEALGYNKVVISTRSGAAGLIPDLCGEKLRITADGDWDAFTHELIAAMARPPADIPATFYDHYYWGNIANKVLHLMRRTSG